MRAWVDRSGPRPITLRPLLTVKEGEGLRIPATARWPSRRQARPEIPEEKGGPGHLRGQEVTGPGACVYNWSLTISAALGDVVEDTDLLLVEECDGAVLAGLQCGAALGAQCVQPLQRLVELAARVGFALDVFDHLPQVGQ